MSLFNADPPTFVWPSSDTVADVPTEQHAPNGASPPRSSSNGSEYSDQLTEVEEEQDDYEQVQKTARPNRWQGTAHKWMNDTRNDRQAFKSLKSFEDDDLSIHLYNVHALKRGLYPVSTDGAANHHTDHKQWHRKEKLLGEVEWYPNRFWTAWPLEPDVVPRGDERSLRVKEAEGDAGALDKDKEMRLAGKPSQELEDVLLAEITKQARYKFEQREWAAEDVPIEDEGSDTAREARAPSTSLKRSRTTEAQGTLETEAGRANKIKRSSVRHDSVGSVVSRSGTPFQHDFLDVKYKPVIMADDDSALALAQPIIRSTVKKLDSLLLALHHSRSNDARALNDRPRDDQCGNGRVIDSSGLSNTDGQTSAEETDSSSTRSRKRSRLLLSQVRPRDWSQVLGMAAVMGWNNATIRRVQARCEALFGEQMVLNAIDVGPYDVTEQELGTDTMHGGVHIDGFMQPLGRRHFDHEAGRYTNRAIARVPSEGGDTDSVQTSRGDAGLPANNRKQCANCGTSDTPNWRRDLSGQKTLCNTCGIYLRRFGQHRPFNEEGSTLLDKVKECANCKTQDETLWRRGKSLALLCGTCRRYEQRNGRSRPLHDEDDGNVKGSSAGEIAGTKNCGNCGRQQKPKEGFRPGPDGPGTLCARCGAYWRRNGRMRPPDADDLRYASEEAVEIKVEEEDLVSGEVRGTGDGLVNTKQTNDEVVAATEQAIVL